MTGQQNHSNKNSLRHLLNGKISTFYGPRKLNRNRFIHLHKDGYRNVQDRMIYNILKLEKTKVHEQ